MGFDLGYNPYVPRTSPQDEMPTVKRIGPYQEARAQAVRVTEDALVVELVDGRVISVPLVWYPRLWYGTPEERANVVLLGEGTILHWPDLDEDLSVEGIVLGRRSGESPESLRRWLESRGGNGGGKVE